MYVVREIVQCKPGKVRQMLGKFKVISATMRDTAQVPFRLLTDVTGDFNRVVFEYEVESVAAFEEMFKMYTTSPEIREKMKGYTDLWMTGSRELLRIV